MKVIRCFHPVGQGAFYTEEFRESNLKFNAVYDCGSSSGKKIVEKEIESTFQKNEIIDVVFISHLHEDHINGIEFLIDYCDVKTIVLPLLNNHSKIVLLLNYLVSTNNKPDSFIEKFIMDAKGIISIQKKDIKIVFVKEAGENTNAIDNIQPIEIQSLKNQIDSGAMLTNSRYDGWVYIPFNFKEEDRYASLIKAMVAESLNIPTSIEEAMDLIKYHRDSLYNAYRKIPGDLNTNSMVVYSGPQSRDLYNMYSIFGMHYRYFSRNAGCMYTGDYNANTHNNWIDLKKNFYRYFSNIGIWQIPHHGSKHNFNPEIAKQGDSIFVISCGYENKYRHPHSFVLRELIRENVPVFIVTEKAGSKVIFESIKISF